MVFQIQAAVVEDMEFFLLEEILVELAVQG
jgi:hypothetical protein